MTQTPLQKRLCVSVFLLNPLELPHNTDTYVETTMRFCFSAEPLELPQNTNAIRLCLSLLNPLADAYAETTLRFCFSAKPSGAAP